jgi:hypothetical protein
LIESIWGNLHVCIYIFLERLFFCTDFWTETYLEQRKMLYCRFSCLFLFFFVKMIKVIYLLLIFFLLSVVLKN